VEYFRATVALLAKEMPSISRTVCTTGSVREAKKLTTAARAADCDGRLVTVGPWLLFSTGTGGALVLDPANQLAA
jgi:hypothetical protein